MKVPFRIVCSEGAAFLTKEERDQLATKVVKMAENMKPGDGFCLFTDHDRLLKVLVKLDAREVVIMRMSEASSITSQATELN